MNRIGGKSNTGEGGEDPVRYQARRQRRPPQQRHQAGGQRPLRRHQRISGQRQGTADQDGPGGQAGRRRPVARPQGRQGNRPHPLQHARRGPDFAAAASRHLFDRRSVAADPRPEERQPRRAHQRQAGGRSRRRHRGRGRGQGQGRRGADQRPRRRHRRQPANLDQARRHSLGTGPGRNAPGAGAERPARPDRRADRRPVAHGPRRGHRHACWAPRNGASPPRRW